MQKRYLKIEKKDRLIKLFSIRLDYTTIDYYYIISNYSILNKLLSICEIIDCLFTYIQESIL